MLKIQESYTMKKHFEVGGFYSTSDFLGFDRYMVKNTRAFVYYKAENGNYKILAKSEKGVWVVEYMSKGGVPMQTADILLKEKKDIGDKLLDIIENFSKGYN